MSTFTYALRTDAGKTVRGTVTATNAGDALLKVRKMGGTAISVTESKSANTNKAPLLSFLKPKLSLKDRIIFTEQLAVMLKAGITLVQAIRGLEEESTNKALSSILKGVIVDVEDGVPLSTSLVKHPSTFSTIYCQMVKSAEKTGNLAGVLEKLTIQQQKEYELRGKVRGAMIYPAIVSVLMIAVIILVITFILPKLSGMFTESGNALPASTRFLLALSDFLVTKYFVVIGILVAFIVGFKLLIRTDTGRMWWDTVKIKFPVIGTFIKKSYMARFCQSFASLAQAGVPVLDVFETLKGVVGNALYEREITAISRDVENGIKVSSAIRKSKHFPPMVGQLVSVGEQSGDLAGIFAVLGDFFEKEVDGMAKNLSTLLEPIIMIVMGVSIGFILIAVLQPIYSLVNAV